MTFSSFCARDDVASCDVAPCDEAGLGTVAGLEETGGLRGGGEKTLLPLFFLGGATGNPEADDSNTDLAMRTLSCTGSCACHSAVGL